MNTPDTQEILSHIDDIIHLMKPRWSSDVSMDGQLPCWIVWLPKHGTCRRKRLNEAIVECWESMDKADLT